MGLAVLVAAITFSAFVTADVILVYTAKNSVNSAGSSPFAFNNGANEPLANSFGILTNTWPAGGPAGPTVSTLVSGVKDVPVEVLQGTIFQLNANLAAADTATFGTINVGTGSFTAGGLTCAYAFITNFPPTSVSGTLTGTSACGIYNPTVPVAASTYCGNDAMVTVDLTNAVAPSGGPISCTMNGALTAPITVLYVSYGVSLTDAYAGGTTVLDTYSIPVTICPTAGC
ncbi:MAG: hypothetical protein KGJ23_00450 [Euryarchaeota archaeon]|nr:hypothetical protein [Euryarchaeota archaeon]MDE1835066.1 hypothetical protein [Euryarchaeota archaeon]MDE1879337.1 hypothetical protein [Euryarchaeota archaeon]MDE2044972.1 hypothetical protein [Thermoplasmata archaeon]